MELRSSISPFPRCRPALGVCWRKSNWRSTKSTSFFCIRQTDSCWRPAYQYRYPITELQQEEFVRKVTDSRDQVYFVAEDPVTSEPFGVCCLERIDYRNQRAEGGIFWDQAAGGEIAAFEAGFLMRD